MMEGDGSRCPECGAELEVTGECPRCREREVWTWARARTPLVILAVFLIAGFSITRATAAHHAAEQSRLADEWYQRGVSALVAHQPHDAVEDFETALVYNRYAPEYRLKLCAALVDAGRISEARSRLLNLYDERPGDAQVNLQLARVETLRGNLNQALRFYQGAIYGAWPAGTDQRAERVQVRYELAHSLLKVGQQQRALSELIALSAELPPVADEHLHLGRELLAAGDPGRAIQEFQIAHRIDRRNVAALIGEAEADVALLNYDSARRHLADALREQPQNAEATSMLHRLDAVLAIDPFAPGLKPAQRNARVIAAYNTATARLISCGVPLEGPMPNTNGPVGDAPVEFTQQWPGLRNWAQQLKPYMSERRLRGRDDVVENTMRFVFQSEATVSRYCAHTTPADDALQMLARRRWGTE
ncbi:MAG TPA: tetratricopeptide repeat protein [Candidatus Acidoferrales bacterium]|nr:tetratricopeptide repeat protein [Candidatus Acidoferrales bacterium]